MKWCREYKHVHMVKRNRKISSHHGEMVKQTWCKSAENKTVKWWIGETVILTFVSHIFLVPLWKWGPTPLLQFICCCIPCLGTSIHLMIPFWSSKHPTRPSNALWCPILPLIFPIKFSFYYLTSTPTPGVFSLWNLPLYCHWYLLVYW